MKNGRPALPMLVACLLLLVTLVTTRAQESGETFDLAVTAIETQPFAAGIGDETNYHVTLENLQVERQGVQGGQFLPLLNYLLTQ